MAKFSFYTWLQLQRKRGDNIGYLAIDTEQDSSRPHGKSGYKIWKKHIDFASDHDPDVMQTFELAWQEYLLACAYPENKDQGQ